MKQTYFIRKTIAAAVVLTLLPSMSIAGVVTADVPAISAPATSTLPGVGKNDTPQAAMNDDAQASGVLPETSTEIWRKTIAAPPSGRIQNRSLQGMQKALAAAYQAGQLQTLPPIAGSNGEILYAYGNSLPTLVTAPLHTSVIMLQPGCHPGMATGASGGSWVLHTVMVGDQPEVTVMPKFAWLHTDLVIPATSADGKPMNYVIEVTSDMRHYTPIIGFYYPDQDIRTWKHQADATAAAKRKANDETVAALPSLNAADLDFNWKVHCSGGGWFSNSDCGSIMPQRVFSDNGHVYIQFKPDQGSEGGVPSILGENSAGKPAIINSQFRDGYYIVDSVPDKILLIAGKGSGGKVVKITREKGN